MEQESVKSIPNDVFFDNIKGILAEGGSVKINVTGRSMDPTFKDRKDVLVISPVDKEKLAVGDVVLFDRGDTICVHRIIFRKGRKLVIRGDGNDKRALEPCTIDDVIGLVTGGTFRGGKPFTIKDKQWQRQTVYIQKYYPIICKFHWLRWARRKYPLSIISSIVLLYLSFCSTAPVAHPDVPMWDKWAHALMYLGLTSVFWVEWLRSHPLSRYIIRKGFVYCTLFPIILGGLIELGQSYLTSTRQGDVLDFAANTIGVALTTIMVFTVLIPWLKKRRNAKKD